MTITTGGKVPKTEHPETLVEYLRRKEEGAEGDLLGVRKEAAAVNPTRKGSSEGE